MLPLANGKYFSMSRVHTIPTEFLAALGSIQAHSRSGWYSIFIFVYIGVVVFGLKSIITALFLKETLQVASQDAEQQAHDQAKQNRIISTNRLRV